MGGGEKERGLPKFSPQLLRHAARVPSSCNVIGSDPQEEISLPLPNFPRQECRNEKKHTRRQVRGGIATCVVRPGRRTKRLLFYVIMTSQGARSHARGDGPRDDVKCVRGRQARRLTRTHRVITENNEENKKTVKRNYR
jgi:hypothetical protein